MTLASLESLRAQGIAAVKHGEKESYYKEFFGVVAQQGRKRQCVNPAGMVDDRAILPGPIEAMIEDESDVDLVGDQLQEDHEQTDSSHSHDSEALREASCAVAAPITTSSSTSNSDSDSSSSDDSDDQLLPVGGSLAGSSLAPPPHPRALGNSDAAVI